MSARDNRSRSTVTMVSTLAGVALLLATVVALVAGCQGGARQDLPGSQVRDSAGIQIVENSRPADDSRLAWRIGPAPSLSIGEVSGEEAYMLHQANNGLVLPDGRIVIGNAGTNEIRVFNASGVHEASWGRAGQGPGEFTTLAGLARWPGDSIAAWDARARMIAVFDSEGTLGRSFVLEAEGRPDEPRMALDGGTVLGRSVDSGATGPGYRRQQISYALRDSDGNRSVSLGVHPGREAFLNMDGPFPVFGLLPFSRSVWEARWGDLIILATDDHYEIRAHDRDTGALARIVRRDYTNRAPTRAEVDEAIDDALERTNLTGEQL